MLIILKIVHFTPWYPYSLYAWCFEENGEYQRNSIACFACIIYISILEIFKYFQDNQAAVSAWTFGPKSLNYYLDPWCTFWASWCALIEKFSNFLLFQTLKLFWIKSRTSLHFTGLLYILWFISDTGLTLQQREQSTSSTNGLLQMNFIHKIALLLFFIFM